MSGWDRNMEVVTGINNDLGGGMGGGLWKVMEEGLVRRSWIDKTLLLF